MNGSLALRLAMRYVKGKRSANVVPVLSRISMVAIAVGSAAMIILFSVFNGFERVVSDLYKSFYADIRITAAKGKFIFLPTETTDKIAHWNNVAQIAPVLEDNVLVNTDEEQLVATLKGVDNRYFDVNEVRPYITTGRDSLVSGIISTAIIGQNIAARIGLDVNNNFSRMQVHYPDASSGKPSGNPLDYFHSLSLKPDGIFRVQDEFDDKYILAPLDQVQTLFGAEGRLSSLEIKLGHTGASARTKQELQQLLGPAYRVETRFEQNHTLYEVLRTEKWATYAILLFVLLIASVNMIGALSLLVLEKQRDIAILSAMGARKPTIRTVFLLEGILWSGIGGLAGLVAGGLICWGQLRFGWIELGGAFVIKAYPVAMEAGDFLLVGCTVLVVGLLAAWYPAFRATSVPVANETIYTRLR